MATRNVHVVRCKDPNDKDTYVDVKVYDQIAYLGPNGQVMAIDTDAKKAIPRVIDNTGDGNGVDNGSPSRISHMEQFTNHDDPDQMLDLEILDAVSFTSPMGKRGVLYMPSNRAVRSVIDTAGLGVGSPGGSAGRKCHTEKVTDKTSDVAKEDEQTDFTGILVTDAVAWQHENGERTVLFLPNVTENDTTEYTADDNGDNTVPPDNSDPNPYVKFPLEDDGSTKSTGPWLGATPDNAQTGYSETPDQGLLWKIVNAKGKGGPWCAMTTLGQPYEWSSLNQNGCIGSAHWDMRCFPYCDAPCSCGCERFWTDYYGPSGCGTTWKRWPCIGAFYWTPCDGSPHGPTGTLPKYGNSSLDSAAWALLRGESDNITKIDFTAEPTERDPNMSLGGWGGWRPNIWQITGMDAKQPHHTDPNTGKEVWDMPGEKLAKEVAKLLEKQWNLTSDAYNTGEKAMDGCGDSACCQWRGGLMGPNAPYSVSIGPSYPSEVADWHFGCAIVDGPTTDKHTIGNPFYPTNAFDFCGGLHPHAWWGGHTIYPCGDKGYTLWAFHPAYATNVTIDQLDRKRWKWGPDDETPTPLPGNTGPIGAYP